MALTFDDGPGEWTRPVLDLLDRYGIKATFFMNGDQVQMRPQIAKEVAKRGHEVGEHTYSHKNFYSLEKRLGVEKTKQAIQEEMSQSKEILLKTLGFEPKLCRMPHGYLRPWLGEVAKGFNYTLVNWTFGEDWLPIPKEKMAADYIRQIRPGAILLFHDGGKKRNKTLEILPLIIEEAKKKGLSLVTVSEIIAR
ncbi:MAG: polysaccharide deacetylase family protein [Elusimicrobia bacterium]|nr:polysaccharide deacetylase family protein [Elusimicrobiota bacterium]